MYKPKNFSSKMLTSSLSEERLRQLDEVFDDYGVKFDLVEEDDDLVVKILDPNYKEKGFEKVAILWSNGSESTDYLLWCLTEDVVFNKITPFN